MTRWLLALIPVTALACSDPPELISNPPARVTTNAPPPAETQDVAAPQWVSRNITASELHRHVAFFADDQRQGRATPSPGLDASARYLADAFSALGLVSPAGTQRFEQRFACADGPEQSANVVGLLRGSHPTRRKEVVLVSAHYDHVGTSEGEGDTIYNGANDNASGTSAMLSIASAFSKRRRAPARSVLFVGFCGEEIGLRGSKHFAANPLIALERIVAHVNLEMLGRPSPKSPPTVWMTGHGYSDLAEIFSEAGTRVGVSFVAGKTIGPTEGAAFNRSDNYPMAKAGVVAHTFATGRIDALYHTVGDEIDTLDFDTMADLVRAIALGVDALASRKRRPRWTQAGRDAGFGA